MRPLRPSSTERPRQTATVTPRTIRELNRAAVLDLIRRLQPISRASISRQIGIHRSNVSDIVEQLLADGVIEEKRATPQGRGRVPLLLTLRETALGIVAVSVRVSESTVVLWRSGGKPEDLFSFPTPSRAEAFVRDMAKGLAPLLARSRKPGGTTIRSIVLSVPGVVRPGKRFWVPALPGYSDFPLTEELQRVTGVPTLAANNAALGALAELWLEEQGSRSLRDFVFLVIGDAGVGSGVVLDRKLYSGHDGTFAGEFGHMVIDPNGPQCTCGRNGCWQLYVSDHATWRRHNPRKKFDAREFHALLEAARAGDADCRKTLRETAFYLSVGLSNIVAALNPAAIIVAGAITHAWAIVEPELRDTVFGSDLRAEVRPARLELDRLFQYGAVYLGLQQVFEHRTLALLDQRFADHS